MDRHQEKTLDRAAVTRLERTLSGHPRSPSGRPSKKRRKAPDDLRVSLARELRGGCYSAKSAGRMYPQRAHIAFPHNDGFGGSGVAKCEFTGKSQMSGNLVSHLNRKSRTVRKKPTSGRSGSLTPCCIFVQVNVSARALRTLSRKGVSALLKNR